MTWEWVALILGTFAIIAILFGWVAWTQMKARFYESMPKTLPDMLTSSKKREEMNG